MDGQLPAGVPRPFLIGLPATPIEPHSDQMIEEKRTEYFRRLTSLQPITW